MSKNTIKTTLLHLKWLNLGSYRRGARVQVQLFLSEKRNAPMEVFLVSWGMVHHVEPSYPHRRNLVVQIRVQCLQVVKGWSIFCLCNTFKLERCRKQQWGDVSELGEIDYMLPSCILDEMGAGSDGMQEKTFLKPVTVVQSYDNKRLKKHLSSWCY